MLLAERVFQQLRGRWKLSRTITDRLTATVMIGEGSASFLSAGKDAAILHYREDLKVSFPDGLTTDAYREYLYKLEAGKIHVYFHGGPDTGKFFYELKFAIDTPKTAAGSHLCISDLYNASYVLHSDNYFEIYYEVKGPKKNYLSQSHYERELK